MFWAKEYAGESKNSLNECAERMVNASDACAGHGRNGEGPPRFSRQALKSGYGCVSRVSPVQTAVCNCTRDEGGPFGFGSQELIPSYRKLLWSKAMVVSVAEKSGR